ncbi:FAR1-related sequence 5-like protein [Tanacetum coccineum]
MPTTPKPPKNHSCSIPRDVIDTGEDSIPRDVFDVGKGSIPRHVQDVNIESIEGQEQIDVSDIESYRNDLDFAPTPNGTPYWRPDLSEDEKPKLGDIFDTFDDGYNMYKVYSEKGRFNICKSGIKRYKGKITHRYVLCNRAGKVRSKFDINTLKEGDAEDEEKDGKRKRKRKTVSMVTNCPAKIGFKAIPGTDCYKLFDFVENHNHPLMNENNMDLSRARDFRGTPGDYRNFKSVVNLFIGDRDAQMIVDKIINRQLHVPEFSFEHHVLHDELVSMFWADDTMKYDFVFVPFTGIDHNQKCVTFGAALLSDETEDSYCWMLKAFLKVHQKQPPLALTDQDAALRNVVVKMFPDSKHRLCIGDLEADSEFRKEYHKLIWNSLYAHVIDSSHASDACSEKTACLDDSIPETYINRRWTKEALPAHLLEKRHIYGPCIEETDPLASEVHATIEDCVGLLRNNTNKLTQFLTTVKEMKKQLEAEMQTSNYDNNKEALYADLLGVTVPEQVVIKNPKKSINKGSKRRKSVAEEVKAKKKPRTTGKVPFKCRRCGKCGGKGHNRRKCTGENVMEEDKVQEVDGEDEVDEEDEIQDVDEDYESDEDNASGEDNSSDEDASAEVKSDDN